MSLKLSSYLRYLTLRLFASFVVFEFDIFLFSLGVNLSLKYYISQHRFMKCLQDNELWFLYFLNIIMIKEMTIFGVLYAWNMWCCIETVNQIKLWCQCYHIAIHESYQREEVLLSYMSYQLLRGVKYFAKLHIDIASIF